MYEQASSSSGSTKYSVDYLKEELQTMKYNKHRKTTKKTYHGVWQNFNKFVIKLDTIPKTWEERTQLYCVHLHKLGRQSGTIKSYVSAIKAKLTADNYNWNDQLILLSTFIGTSRLENDTVRTRLPIGRGLLELILNEIKMYYSAPKRNQPYLEILFKALFSAAYFSLLRIGELTLSPHVLKAKDVHLATNKSQILFVLYSSKTHSKASHPQKIRIFADQELVVQFESKFNRDLMSPFDLLNDYLRVRGGYDTDSEPFFIYRDGTPVAAVEVRKLLKRLLRKLQLNPNLYNTHSFRIGRATDLMKKGVPAERIKRFGRWKSNAVYKYLRC